MQAKIYKKIARNQGGNIMVMSIGVILIIFMFFAVMIDFGRYYSVLKDAKRVMSIPSRQIDQLVNYYAFSGNPRAEFQNLVDQCASDNGYDTSKIHANIRMEARGSSGGMGGTATMLIETTVTYESRYNCLILPVMGIKELPVRVEVKTGSTFTTGENYRPGDPYDEWSPP